MLNGLGKDGNIIISSKRQHYFTVKALAPSKGSTNAKVSLIFDEVNKLKESNINVATNCTWFLRKGVPPDCMGIVVLDSKHSHNGLIEA